MDTSIESVESLLRKKPLITQDVLKSFIRESTSSSTPWIVHDELAWKYMISIEPPIKYPIEDSLVQPG